MLYSVDILVTPAELFFYIVSNLSVPHGKLFSLNNIKKGQTIYLKIRKLWVDTTSLGQKKWGITYSHQTVKLEDALLFSFPTFLKCNEIKYLWQLPCSRVLGSWSNYTRSQKLFLPSSGIALPGRNQGWLNILNKLSVAFQTMNNIYQMVQINWGSRSPSSEVL